MPGLIAGFQAWSRLRALDLELILVPRKTVPAVHSIVRSTRPAPPCHASSIARELAKLETVTGKIAEQYGAMKEISQLQSRIHDLTRIDLPSSYLDSVEMLNKHLQQIHKQPVSVQKLLKTGPSIIRTG